MEKCATIRFFEYLKLYEARRLKKSFRGSNFEVWTLLKYGVIPAKQEKFGQNC